MPWLGIFGVVAATGAIVLVRDNPLLLTLAATIWGVCVTTTVERLRALDGTLIWSILKASTIYRRRATRVSLAYLISIETDNRYLLVRGRRIPTQFQPVGGVFKTDLTLDERRHRFNALEDTRFPMDSDLSSDLRITLPGANLAKLLRWFRSGVEREVLPIREFYEELVAPGILDPQNFQFIDCERLGERSFPLKVDKTTGMPQLILAEIWRLRPTPAQAEELSRLKPPRGRRQVLMAERAELEGVRTAMRPANYEIAPTAEWLLTSRGGDVAGTPSNAK